MKNIGVVRMFCTVAANIAIMANQFKGRIEKAANDHTDVRHRTGRTRGYWGTGSCYDPHYGAQASARNFRHVVAGTHGTHNTMASLVQRGLAPWATV